MRSAQIEAVLGKTRLGVRDMLDALFKAGLVARTSVSGVWMYRFAPPSPPAEETLEQPASHAFSTEALGEYEAANAEIDRLIAGDRSNAAVDAFRALTAFLANGTECIIRLPQSSSDWIKQPAKVPLAS
jgi:hypothetical protein